MSVVVSVWVGVRDGAVVGEAVAEASGDADAVGEFITIMVAVGELVRVGEGVRGAQ